MCEELTLDNMKFDVIVIGTGLCESILACSLSKVGKKVLQIDCDGFYGGEMATLSLEEMAEWINEEPSVTESIIQSSHTQFQKRKITILFRAKDPVIELMARSKVYIYSTFYQVDNIVMAPEDKQTKAINIIKVPCNRAEVFADQSLSFKNKRLLMKFCEKCLVERQMSEEKTLADQISDYPYEVYKIITDAICMTEPSTSLPKAMDRAYRLVTSSGKYGPSPLLASGYGSSDLCQSFCRLAAVNGCVYCLKANVLHLKTNPETSNCILDLQVEDRIAQCQVETNQLLLNSSMIKCADIAASTIISRCIFVRNGSNLLGKSKYSLLLYSNEPVEIYFIEQEVNFCSSLSVVYASCNGAQKHDYIKRVYSQLSKNQPGSAILIFEFDQIIPPKVPSSTKPNIFEVSGVSDRADFFISDPDLTQIHQTFKTMCQNMTLDTVFKDDCE